MPGKILGAITLALMFVSCSVHADATNPTTAAAPVAALTVQAPVAGLQVVPSDPLKTFTEPLVPEPKYFAPFTDPVFGTTVTRIAGDPGTAIGGGVSGTWGSDVRQHYSKDQPWNSNGTLLALQNDGGGMVLLDGETYQPKKGKCSSYSLGDDRWHPSPAHPNERINVRGSELMWYDVVNCVKTRSWTLPFAVDYFGPSEGNPSFDGRYAALTDGTRMFVVDMDPQPPFAAYPAQRIGPAINIDDCGLSGGCTIDWVSISPSGKYAVVSYDGDFPRVYDVNPNTLALTPHVMPAGSLRCHGTADQGFIYDLGHADMTLNPFDNNEDVIIGQEHCGNRGKTVGGILMSGVVMVRLKDDRVTPLTNSTNEAYPHHISTRNYDRPGWVYVGYHSESGKKFSDEIIAVKLDGSKAVQRFAHKHSVYSGCYRCESHSVPSRDGRRVLWASNWALSCTTCGASSDIKPYVVDARALAPAGAPAVAPYAIIANASRSTDDGRIVSYKFDFGDGTVTAAQISPFASHIYRAGRWNLKLTVTDDSGASSTTAQTVDVGTVANNQPPVAALTLAPASGIDPLTVVADASASRDAEGPIMLYRFDFGDGSAPAVGETPQVTHVYAAGTWTASVTVTDAAGAENTARATVTVVAPPPDTVSVNLVGNPSFETDLTGWKGYGGATIARIPSDQDGEWGVKVTGGLLSSVFGINDGPNWVSKVPAAGTRYRVTAWVRALGMLGTIRLQVREYLNGVAQQRTVYSDPVRLGLWWQQVSVDIVAKSAGSTIDVQVTDTPLIVGEVFYVDDISIRVVRPGLEPEGALASHAVADSIVPAAVALAPRVSPNPMPRRGALDFSTPRAGALRVELYDAAGRLVRVLANEPFMIAGSRHLEIDGRDERGAPLEAGVYFYRVQSTAGVARGRFVLMR